MMMIYSMINVPYASLLGVMSFKPAVMYFPLISDFAYIGSFIALLLIEPLVEILAKIGDHGCTNLQLGWQLAVSVIAVICVALFLLGFLCG
jgi:GPH family glycoside/pentoside/hexuronide:cation symporter